MMMFDAIDDFNNLKHRRTQNPNCGWIDFADCCSFTCKIRHQLSDSWVNDLGESIIPSICNCATDANTHSNIRLSVTGTEEEKPVAHRVVSLWLGDSVACAQERCRVGWLLGKQHPPLATHLHIKIFRGISAWRECNSRKQLKIWKIG